MEVTLVHSQLLAETVAGTRQTTFHLLQQQQLQCYSSADNSQ